MLFKICKTIIGSFFIPRTSPMPEIFSTRTLVILSFIISSAIFFEYYLSYFIFKYLITALKYNELEATYLTAIGLFLEIILLIICLHYRRSIPNSSNKLVSAFTKGFKSK
jgi:hypothetical protein